MKLDLLLTVDWDYLKRFLAVNLLGALVCTRACYQSMAERGGGAIVNQSSTAAYLYAGYYGWAKAGRQLAHPAAGPRARRHEHPGERHRPGAHRHRGGPVGGARRVHAASSWRSLALKRQGKPEDLVGMCLFLLSDDAAWVTGHVFNVDGGQVMRP